MIIITTSHSIIKLDKETLQWEIIESGNGLYYGIDKFEDKIYVAARKRILSSEESKDNEDGEIRVFDKDFNLVEIIKAPFLLRDMHQIRFIDSKLYVTCTYDNMIAIRHIDGSWEKWFPLGEPQEEVTDINHFNTITEKDDEIIINCHNLDNPSQVLYFDKQHNLKRTLEIGKQIHNYWKSEDEIFTCSSKESRIISTGGFDLFTGGYPRGYLNVDNLHFIGISELAERFFRDFKNGRIKIFDKDWQLKTTVVLTKQGLVSDLLSVS